MDSDDIKIARDKERAKKRRDRFRPQQFSRALAPWVKKNLSSKQQNLGVVFDVWPKLNLGFPNDAATPIKVSFPGGSKKAGILHLSVASRHALLIQSQNLAIIDRVNTLVGYRMIDRLSLKHR